MNRWDNLSLQEKNQLLGIYASKGYTDLASIINHYNTFQAGGSIKKESNYSVGRVLGGIYRAVNHEEFMGEPSHKYQFIKPEYVGLSEEELDSLVGQADERGHRLDVVKAEAHPSHYSRGTWSGNDFELTDKGLAEVNHTYFGLNDGGQDPQARLTYKGSTVLPEITITPDGAYIYNTYDNIKLHLKQQGGSLGKVTPYGQWRYPHQVTTIPSNNITMKGVDYPVIGVSNTGDTKYMLPNMDYLFEGQYVTEYPVHKFQEGGVSATTPTRQLPQVNITGDIAQDWITSWTSNRKSQLRNNYLDSRNVFKRMKDSVTGNKNEKIENDILSKQLEGMYNMEQYISSNPLEVYSSENPDYKVKKKDINKWVSGDTLAETFHKSNKIYYNPTDTDFKEVSEVPFTLRVHENTHALADSYRDRNKHAKTPQEKIIDKKYRKYFLENYDNYLSQPSEIYSRLMELRFKTGLKPTDKVDWDWYIEHQDAIKNLHLLFDENKLIDLLNEVAVNDKAHQESNYA